jgi:hypothetical protein
MTVRSPATKPTPRRPSPRTSSPKGYTFSLAATVTDPEALFRQAHVSAVSNNMSDEDILDWLGTADQPKIGNCLTHLFDPGDKCPEGVEILGSGTSPS